MFFKALSNFAPEAYDRYINYERRQKHIDLAILSTLYERVIADVSRARLQNLESAEAALRLFWCGYCDVLVRLSPTDQSIISQTRKIESKLRRC